MYISVVMPVYNGEKYINDSIESILAQTFKDFELIIIDDGSDDNTVNLIEHFKDQRIRLLHNSHNFIHALNKGLDIAQGKYIARMDADDIMNPNRLAVQYKLMEKEKKIIVCASWIRMFGEKNRECPSFRGQINHPLIQMLEGNILAHPTVMIRKNFLVKHQLKYENYQYAEDFKLWSEIAKKGGEFYIIPDFLLDYRISYNQISTQKKDEQSNTSLRIQSEILEFLIKLPTKEKKQIEQLATIINNLNEQSLISEKVILKLFFDLFSRLANQNPHFKYLISHLPS